MVYGFPVIRYLDDLSPESVIDGLFQLSREVDALAVVASDQPQLHDALL